MDSEKITIKTIRLCELEQFTESCRNASEDDQIIPVSTARVHSQVNNPCADDNDIAMVAAFSGSRCVGYHGMMPGLCVCRGEVVKVYWATTFFVVPAMRGRGVGKRLIKAILQLDVDFISTRMTESAERAYRSIGLKPFGYLHYRQLRADKLKKSLLGKGTFSESSEKNSSSLKSSIIGRIDKTIYSIALKIFYTRLLHEVCRRHDRMRVREVPRIKDWQKRVLQRKALAHFFRPVTVVNWMLEFPWVFSENEVEKVRDYYFSTTREFFTYKAFQIYSKDRQTVLGFTVVSILSHRGKTVVKLLDYDFQRPDLDYMALVIALRCSEKHCADRVEYSESLHRHLPRSLSDRRLVKQQQRLYVFHPGKHNSPLLENKDNFTLDYCDGDIVFT